MKGRNTVIIHLTIHKWSGVKIDRRATTSVNNEFEAKKSGNFFKSLVSKEMIDAINKKASEIRQAHYKHSLPFMDNGARVVPVSAYFKYLDVINELVREFDGLADHLCDKYDEILKDSEVRLGKLFRESEYPSKEIMRKKFAIELSKLPFPETDDLRMELEEGDMAAMKADFKDQMEHTVGKAENSLWDRLDKAIVAYIAATEPAKTFKGNTIRKMGPLSELVPTLNFTDMEGVDDVCNEIKRDLTKHSPDTIRGDSDIRADLNKKAKNIRDSITRKRYGI